VQKAIRKVNAPAFPQENDQIVIIEEIHRMVDGPGWKLEVTIEKNRVFRVQQSSKQYGIAAIRLREYETGDPVAVVWVPASHVQVVEGYL